MKILKYILIALLPTLALAINITVPSAPGSGYMLLSTSTGQYIATTSGVTTSSSGTATQVSFFTGSNTISSDPKLYWDNTNKGLSIGGGPASIVNGLYVAGNVGIGTTSPSSLLTVGNTNPGHSNPTISVQGNGDLMLNTQGVLFFDNNYSYNTGSYIGPYSFTSNTYDANTIKFTTAGTERVRIANNGNVGIGTTSPAQRLDVNGGISSNNNVTVGNAPIGATRSVLTNYYFKIFYGTETDPRIKLDPDVIASGQGGIAMKYENGNGYTIAAHGVAVGIAGDKSLGLYTSNGTSLTERMRIDGTGNVGIGTTTPLQKFVVSGQGVFASAATSADPGDTSGFATRIGFYSIGGYGYVNANNSGVAAANLILQQNGGNVGIGTTTPSYKLHIYGGVGLNTGLFLQADATKQATQYFGDTSTAIFRPANTTNLALYAGGATAMTISSSAIGIGTTSPLQKFEVYGSGNLAAFGNGTDGVIIGNGTGVGKIIGVDSAIGGYNDLDIRSQAGTQLYLSTNGNVGIGTTSPASQFTVSKTPLSTGAIATTTVEFGDYSTTTSKACFNTKNTDGTAISFYFVGTSMVVENNRCK